MKISMFAFVILSMPLLAMADEPCPSEQEGYQQPPAESCDTPQPNPSPAPAPTPLPAPSGPSAQAPTPASYLYLAWLEWRKHKRRPLSGDHIREIGGRGLIGWNEGGSYYDDYSGEQYYRDPFLGGIGGSLYLRAYQQSTGLGLEASWDFINYHGLEELRQAALMKYSQIDQRTRAYALVGGGLTTYDPGYSAQAGVGLDFSLTKRLSIHADLRVSYVSSHTSLEDYCGYQPSCGGGYYYAMESLETVNAVLNVGGGWRFVSLLERVKDAAP